MDSLLFSLDTNFHGFRGIGEPTDDKCSKGLYRDFGKITKLNVHKSASCPSSTKIGAHENK